MKIINLLFLSGVLAIISGCGGGGGSAGSSSVPGNASVTPSSSSSVLSSSSVSSVLALTSSSASISSASSTSSVTAFFPDYNKNPLPADATGMQSNAAQLASKIKLGWNIGNTMEAIGGETAWGNPQVSKELIQLLKAKGFDAVRIPLAWDQYANPQTAEISATWLERVKQVVQYALDSDMYVLINIHWDGGWLENNVVPARQEQNNAKQKAFWEQIATELRDFDERVMFASANEPNVENAEQMQVLLSYHQTFVDTVRATGGKNAYRVLVVQGPSTDIEKTNKLWPQMPVDSVSNRLMSEVHFYSPYNFVLMSKDESWGKQAYYWGKGFHSATDTEHNPTWGEEEYIDTWFKAMKTQFVDKGIPVLLGEFGAMRRTNLTGDALTLHLAGRAYYHKYVVQQALANGMLPFYWDNGGLDNFSSGIIDRKQNTIADQQTLDALLEGAGK